MKRIIPLLLAALLLTACGATNQPAAPAPELEYMPLSHAAEFTVGRYDNGCSLITVGEDKYLVIPEGGEAPASAPADAVVLQQPIENVYLQATSAMDLICALDKLPSVRLSGTEQKGWYVPQAAEAMARGELLYAGKYSAPDYETILENDCGLAIESTMILHKPEVREQLNKLGVPVFVERSSYETDPLGRMEWIKLYGVLFGCEELAEQIYNEKLASISSVLDSAPTDKTVAFFSINSNGSVTVHKPGGYVSRMVEYAGGSYIPAAEDEEDNALSTMNMQMEAFFAEAKDADVIIYNSTIDGGISDISQLLDKSAVMADFRAVQTGNVWCTDRSLFQQSMSLSDMIADINSVLTEENPQNLTYLNKLS